MSETWKRCNVCKREIPLEGNYYVCSVSTCNRKRTGLVFCSVECWDAHLPDAHHRSDAGAIEEKAPSRTEAARMREEQSSPPRPVEPPVSARTGERAGEPLRPTAAAPAEILVVASKVKKYIRETAGMNTSASALDALTRCVETLCEMGIENAGKEERKTVMDRDIPMVLFQGDPSSH